MERKQENDIARSLHISSLKIGIISFFLIGGAFFAFYLGVTNAYDGFQGDNLYDEYILYQRPIDVEGDGDFEVLAYTPREVEEQRDINKFYGMNNDNNIILLNARNGEIRWSFKLQKPNFVVSSVNFITQGNISDDVEPLIIVQYAQVKTIEYVVPGDPKETNPVDFLRIFNETGYYETYMLDLSTQGKGTIAFNLSDKIQERIFEFQPLTYNPIDNYPDFLLLTMNITKEEQDQNILGNVSFHAFFSNGTLNWTSSNSSLGTIPDLIDVNLKQYETHGVQVNTSHFAFITPIGGLYSFDIQDGSISLNETPGISDVRGLYSCNIDYTSDGINDLFIQYFNGSDSSLYTGFLNATNGSLLNLPAPIKVDHLKWLVDLRSEARFELGKPDLLVGWDLNEYKLLFYRITQNGLEINMSYNFPESNQEWNIPLHLDYFAYQGGEFYLFDVSYEDKVIIDVKNENIFVRFDTSFALPKEQIIGDLVVNQVGIETCYISRKGLGGYTIFTIHSRDFLFLNSDTNLVLFISSIAIAIISLVLLLKERRNYNILKRDDFGKEELEESSDREKSLKKLKKLSNFLLTVQIFYTAVSLGMLIFMVQFLRSPMFDAMSSLYLVLSLILATLPLVNSLYYHLAPAAAFLIIKIQKSYFRRSRPDSEHRIVVLDMKDYGKTHNPIMIIGRSLFPISISLTIGLIMFQLFATVPLEGGEAAGINLPWMAEFEIYVGLFTILSYIVIAFIIPGSWLLEDTGVAYFEEPTHEIAPGGISSVSKWLLMLFQGAFGITAIINYLNVFGDFNLEYFAQFGWGLGLLQLSTYILAFVLAPIFHGMLSMTMSNKRILQDLEYNKRRLFEKMEASGIDTTPRRLRNFFENVP
ncbi:MAG: hypothetical protein ACFFCS_20515 [Candidatus Hodarchaeota archaeon]